ncbi:hypothetical protein CRE_00332 [Caenorhabditis remanei]|uniref:Uncharacterized protein n=1 Tax=Caenorhabditis remanei TaxID=31234 RepID=E3LEJ7_CAERE|nr:hypothetical protein CRE_00332 [Caenorhabditis remanei]
MNQYDKTRYDVISHLTDIPFLGKQYVPGIVFHSFPFIYLIFLGLWKQFEGENYQSIPQQQAGQELINQRTHTSTTTAQNEQLGRASSSAQIGGGSRVIEKRSLPTSSNNAVTSQFTAPAPKIPRI